MRSIKDIADVQLGYQVRAGLIFEPEGAYQVIQAKDIDEENDHALKADNLQRINTGKPLSSYLVDNGSLIFLSRGRRRSATVVRGLLPGSPPTVALYYFYIIRLADSSILPDFLAWIINESEAREYLASVSRGTGIPYVAKEDFVKLEFKVPPLVVQEAIVHIHHLSLREGQLLRSLGEKRLELRRKACSAIYAKEAWV